MRRPVPAWFSTVTVLGSALVFISLFAGVLHLDPKPGFGTTRGAMLGLGVLLVFHAFIPRALGKMLRFLMRTLGLVLAEILKTRWPFVLALVVCVALAFRLVMLFHYIPSSPWVADMVLWDAEMGRNIHNGRGWVMNQEFVKEVAAEQNRQARQMDLADFPKPDDSRPGALQPFTTWAHTPGYALWFAISYWLGGDERYLYSQLMQLTLDSFVCLFLFGIGRRLWSAKAGILAALLYALSPAHAFLANLPVSACLDSFAFLGTSYGIVRTWEGVEQGRWPWTGVLWTGASSALGAAMNSTAFVLPMVTAALCVFLTPFSRPARRMLAHLLLAQLLVVAILLPWGIRNQRVNGHFSLTRQTFWQFAWETLGEVPNPWGLALEDDGPYWRWTQANCPLPCTPVKREAFTRRYLLSKVVLSPQFPGHVWRLVMLRFPRMIGVLRVPVGRFGPGTGPWLRARLEVFFKRVNPLMPAVFPLALVGLGSLLKIRREKFIPAILGLAPSLFALALSLVFYVEIRKTVPPAGYLFVFVSMAVCAFFQGALRLMRPRREATVS